MYACRKKFSPYGTVWKLKLQQFTTLFTYISSLSDETEKYSKKIFRFKKIFQFFFQILTFYFSVSFFFDVLFQIIFSYFNEHKFALPNKLAFLTFVWAVRTRWRIVTRHVLSANFYTTTTKQISDTSASDRFSNRSFFQCRDRHSEILATHVPIPRPISHDRRRKTLHSSLEYRRHFILNA